jgi:hypothetical protein
MRTLKLIRHHKKVIFGPGAKVQSVKLCSDYSSVQVLRLPPGATASTIADLFEHVLGFTIPKSEITLNEVADEVVATIKYISFYESQRDIMLIKIADFQSALQPIVSWKSLMLL